MTTTVSRCVRCSLLQLATKQSRIPSRQTSTCLDRLLDSCDEKLRTMRRDATYHKADELNPKIKSPHIMLTHYPRKLLSFRSTDYLGLSNNPHVVAAFNRGMIEYDSKRYTSDRHDIRDLEITISELHQREDCLSFTSLEEGLRFVFHTLFSGDDVIFYDEYNSLAAKMALDASGARQTPYKHCDIDDLEHKLKSANTKGVNFILTEGYYSKTGDSVNLRKLMALAKEYNSLVILEDSHAIGILGHSIRGMEDTLSDNNRPFLTFGSLENVFGQHSGGYVVGPSLILDAVYEHCKNPEESISPGVVAAAQKILTNVAVLQKPAAEMRKRSFELKEALRVPGWMPRIDEHPAMSVMVGDERKADCIVDHLIDVGICVGALKYPVVPKGAARLNFFLTRLHTDDHVAHMLDALKSVGKRLKLPDFLQVKHLF